MPNTKNTSAAPKRKRGAVAREVPDWVTKTPQVGYDLEMWDEFNGAEQTIELTRDEYLALKKRLAELRGFVGVNDAA